MKEHSDLIDLLEAWGSEVLKTGENVGIKEWLENNKLREDEQDELNLKLKTESVINNQMIDEIQRLRGLLETNYQQVLELGAIAQDKEALLEEYREELDDIDFTLAYFEDFIHGEDGCKITQKRKQIQRLLNKKI